MTEDRKRLRSDAFRQAHQEILQLLGVMTPRLVPAELQRDANEARAMLSKLAGKLTIHLAMEDRALYPRLTSHTKPEVRALAERFEKEMGGILGEFKEYLARWPTAESIQSNSAAFVTETGQMFDALRARIAKEDAEIFPRFDET